MSKSKICRLIGILMLILFLIVYGVSLYQQFMILSWVKLVVVSCYLIIMSILLLQSDRAD
ncbi:MAG: hypothetical protein MR425_06910 [Lachnospiraceae bacterium]|nr:hypothetical protein [Lachnospiraceae bacterium]